MFATHATTRITDTIMSSFAALASETGGGERKSGGSGNAASHSVQIDGSVIPRSAKHARFAAVVSDWTVARVGCRVYVKIDFVVPVLRRNRRRRMRTTRKTFKKKKGRNISWNDADVARVNVDNNTVGWYNRRLWGHILPRS